MEKLSKNILSLFVFIAILFFTSCQFGMNSLYQKQRQSTYVFDDNDVDNSASIEDEEETDDDEYEDSEENESETSENGGSSGEDNSGNGGGSGTGTCKPKWIWLNGAEKIKKNFEETEKNKDKLFPADTFKQWIATITAINTKDVTTLKFVEGTWSSVGNNIYEHSGKGSSFPSTANNGAHDVKYYRYDTRKARWGKDITVLNPAENWEKRFYYYRFTGKANAFNKPLDSSMLCVDSYTKFLFVYSEPGSMKKIAGHYVPSDWQDIQADAYGDYHKKAFPKPFYMYAPVGYVKEDGTTQMYDWYTKRLEKGNFNPTSSKKIVGKKIATRTPKGKGQSPYTNRKFLNPEWDPDCNGGDNSGTGTNTEDGSDPGNGTDPGNSSDNGTGDNSGGGEEDPEEEEPQEPAEFESGFLHVQAMYLKNIDMGTQKSFGKFFSLFAMDVNVKFDGDTGVSSLAYSRHHGNGYLGSEMYTLKHGSSTNQIYGGVVTHIKNKKMTAPNEGRFELSLDLWKYDRKGLKTENEVTLMEQGTKFIFKYDVATDSIVFDKVEGNFPSGVDVSGYKDFSVARGSAEDMVLTFTKDGKSCELGFRISLNKKATLH